jgi:hypothetical protein
LVSEVSLVCFLVFWVSGGSLASGLLLFLVSGFLGFLFFGSRFPVFWVSAMLGFRVAWFLRVWVSGSWFPDVLALGFECLLVVSPVAWFVGLQVVAGRRFS